MTPQDNGLRYHGPDSQADNGVWKAHLDATVFDEASVRSRLLNLGQACTVVRRGDRIGLLEDTHPAPAAGASVGEVEPLISVPPLQPQHLGDPNFLDAHGVEYAYATGSMANGIACEELVISMGKAKMLSSYGAAGVMPDRLETAIRRIQAALPTGPWAFNLIHSPNEDYLERKAVDLYLQHGVSTVEASAFLDLTAHVVRYRVAGLSLGRGGEIEIKNRVIAKLSRREVAAKFMQPAPERILSQLLDQGLITEQQALLAEKVPMADDITVEADSGGHTDNRPLVGLLPSIQALRDEIQEQHDYPASIRVGAAGGISTPTSALAAFTMGAAYVVTGSVNQACLEARASQHTKQLLAEAGMADVIMAPAADMFEMGVKVQVLKRGTLFPMRAQKLYDYYRAYTSVDEIPVDERRKLEQQIFKRSLEEIWADTVTYFAERDPEQITRAEADPKRKMGLIFRWYLGLSSRWSNYGEAGREIDYQIWCGPSMGAFNDWVRGSYLAEPENRSVVEVARHIMTGAAYLYRIHSLQLQGLQVPARYSRYTPTPLEATTEHAAEASAAAVRQPAAESTAEAPTGVPRQAEAKSAAEAPAPAVRQPAAESTAEMPTRVPAEDHVRAQARPSPAQPGNGQDAEAIQAWIVTHIAQRMGLEPDNIDIREPFDSFDLDSAQVLVLADELEKWLGRRLSPTLLWNYPNIEALAERLSEDTVSH